MHKETRAAAEKIARKIVRLKGRKIEEQNKVLDWGPSGPQALADAALKIENIDGRIEGLHEALGILLGRDVTDSDIANLTA